MAKGNLAVELFYYARITRHLKFFLDANEMLGEVLSGNILQEYASGSARGYFEKVVGIYTKENTNKKGIC